MAGILLDKAYLTAIWLETMFYGSYTILYDHDAKPCTAVIINVFLL